MEINKQTPARVNPVRIHPEEKRVSLNGQWHFCLDPDDVGLEESWQQRPELLTQSITVPGCWQGQGFGDDGNDVVWDFGLEARTFRATYTGTGWYATEFHVPENWARKRIWLNFGGVHPSCEVWLNQQKLGENDLPFVPFGFEATSILKHDHANTLVLRVHEKNREFGLAYNWQGNWSGLYRGVELTATGQACFKSFCLYPDVDQANIVIKAEIDGDMADPMDMQVSVYPQTDPHSAIARKVQLTDNSIRIELDIPSPVLWSPDAPNLYVVDAELVSGEVVLDALSERCGFVKLSTDNNHFLINNQPFYMRGTGDFLSCPETGCPDTDRERWRRKLKALRAYGYNFVRCQSYVYGPEYYDAADEAGILVQSEMGMLGAWGSHNKWHVYQWPKPTPDNYPTLKEQWDLTVHRDVNHPSANIYCMSNEYACHLFHFPRIAWACYHDTKSIKPTAMVIWTDGGYADDLPGDFINDAAEKQITDTNGRTGRLVDVADKPVIQHEFRWWSSFPDVGISGKYDGAVRHYAASIAREAAAKHGLAHLLDEFAEASKRLQFVEAKARMEECRREFEKMAGICHFNAMDTNPSPQGIIDEFYQLKYADAQTWLQTNGDTVILSDLAVENRVFQCGQEFSCAISVSDFSHPPLVTPTVHWQLSIDNVVVERGSFSVDHRPFCSCSAGTIRFTIPQVPTAASAVLEAELVETGRTISNRWHLWVLPTQPDITGMVRVYGNSKHCRWLKELPNAKAADQNSLKVNRDALILTETVDDALEQYMRDGGRVILAATEGMLRPHPPNFGYIKYFFTPPANYAPYEDGQNGTIIQDHPALSSLPHEGFADLQFFRLMADAPPIDLAPFGLQQPDPIIRVIHRYPVCHPLGYLLERPIGKGGIIITSLNLDQRLPEGRCLLKGICDYAISEAFHPAAELSAESLTKLKKATELP